MHKRLARTLVYKVNFQELNRDLSVFLYPIKKSHLNLNEANQFMRFEIQLKIYARKFLEQRNNKAAQYDFIS